MRGRFRGCFWNTLGGMDVLMPAILFILAGEPSYGYVLPEKLSALGIKTQGCHPSVLYRMLRMMEMEGLVTSSWDTEGPGPARRIYAITEEGGNFLRGWTRSAREWVTIVQKLIQAVEDGGE